MFSRRRGGKCKFCGNTILPRAACCSSTASQPAGVVCFTKRASERRVVFVFERGRLILIAQGARERGDIVQRRESVKRRNGETLRDKFEGSREEGVRSSSRLLLCF